MRSLADWRDDVMPALIPDFGARLRCLRRIRGLKQSAVVADVGRTQTTISRWQSGEIKPEPALACKLLIALGADACQLSDGPLRRLIETSPLPVHLVDDIDHRLLAASWTREQEWRRSASEPYGQSLWRFATAGIEEAEDTLNRIGWWCDRSPGPVEVHTGSGNAGLRIRTQVMLWERLHLADGTPVRLCTTLAYA